MLVFTGSVFVSSLETGGILGAVLAGYAADKLVAMVNTIRLCLFVIKND